MFINLFLNFWQNFDRSRIIHIHHKNHKNGENHIIEDNLMKWNEMKWLEKLEKWKIDRTRESRDVMTTQRPLKPLVQIRILMRLISFLIISIRIQSTIENQNSIFSSISFSIVDIIMIDREEFRWITRIIRMERII
jgi:hypothetical protein